MLNIGNYCNFILIDSLKSLFLPLSVEVSLVTMPPKRTIDSFFTASSRRRCQQIQNETAADDGKVGGGPDKAINMLGG